MKRYQKPPTIPNVKLANILTLDQALALADGFSILNVSQTEQKEWESVVAVVERITVRCRRSQIFSPSLSHGEQLVLSVRYMQGEILNGGFHQYLTNSTADDAEQLLSRLEQIKAAKMVELFRRIAAFFPENRIPSNRENRTDLIKKFEESHRDEKHNKWPVDPFENLDNVFALETGNLTNLLLNFIRTHRSDFNNPSDAVVSKYKTRGRIEKYYSSVSEETKS